MSYAITIRPIETDEDLEATLRRVEQIIGAKRGTPEGTELDVLGTLIAAYEREHFPIETLGPIKAIRYALDEAGLRDKVLIPFIGPQSRVSDDLAGRLQLSLSLIRRLHEGLGIPLESLIQPTTRTLAKTS